MHQYFMQKVIILDASCVINLYASGHMREILHTASSTVAVATYVAKEEALWVRTINDEGRELIDLQRFVEAGLLHIVDIETEEEAETVATLAALRLHQGEAITAAIAIQREWAVATDDRRAHTVIGQRAKYLQILSTLELVKYWADSGSVSTDMVSKSLQRIRQLAVYTPHRQHPLYKWWHEHHGG